MIVILPNTWNYIVRILFHLGQRMRSVVYQVMNYLKLMLPNRIFQKVLKYQKIFLKFAQIFKIFSQYRKIQEVITITRPHAISEYTFMGGVDMVDRMIAHYPHGIKSKKWYLRVFVHLLNVSLVNAWLCFTKSVDGKMDLLSFKSFVANALIAKGLCDTKKRGRPSSMSPNNTPTLKKK
uniref:PiggyBac transposable element-derived protein domain-containing protein n=1 Tax=Homalodisca liturata TaxID=320908 RepID=A0A1B6IJU4_9HEMI